MDLCPRCGADGKLSIEPFMKGTLSNGERLDYYRCGACRAIVSRLTPVRLREPADASKESGAA